LTIKDTYLTYTDKFPQASMTALIRAAALQGFETAASTAGVAPQQQLQKVGLPASCLEAPESFIPYAAFIRLLEETAFAGQCADFGLRLARHQQAYLEGPLTVLMRHAQSLNEALALGAQYGYVFSPAMRASLVPVADQPTLVDVTLNIHSGPPGSCAQTTEFVLLGILHVLRWLTDDQVRPVVVLLPHAAINSPQVYAHYLACDCRFDATFAAVRVRLADLSLQLPARNPLLLQMARGYIEHHYGSAQPLLSDKVRIMVRQRLAMGRVTQADLAQALALHPKTLQRRLVQEGERFDALVDGVRRERFVELLAQPTRPSLAQIAVMVGYSEQSALARSCQRWFGRSPSAMRSSACPTTCGPSCRPC
jgi:AraC-like DNA-binding protein